jgi:hypothetical protein
MQNLKQHLNIIKALHLHSYQEQKRLNMHNCYWVKKHQDYSGDKYISLFSTDGSTALYITFYERSAKEFYDFYLDLLQDKEQTQVINLKQLISILKIKDIKAEKFNQEILSNAKELDYRRPDIESARLKSYHINTAINTPKISTKNAKNLIETCELFDANFDTALFLIDQGQTKPIEVKINRTTFNVSVIIMPLIN